jgi:hypothetical protein
MQFLFDTNGELKEWIVERKEGRGRFNNIK